jgi:hypothetical protein
MIEGSALGKAFGDTRRRCCCGCKEIQLRAAELIEWASEQRKQNAERGQQSGPWSTKRE